MDLMKELLDEGKKTTVSRAAAHAVYHRDYVKTKKKPYRKYDGNGNKSYEDEETTEDVVDDELSEGMWDFVKGAGRHVGQAAAGAADAGAQLTMQAAHRVQQGVQNTVQAGQQASQQADGQRLTKLLIQSFQRYFELKGGTTQQPNQQPAAVVRANRQPAPAAQQLPPRSFTQQHKARDGGMQFSSYLATLDNSDLITEGAWDFIKGAGRAVGNAVRSGVQQGAQRVGQAAQAGAQRVQQGVQNTIQAGQQASQQADTEAASNKVKQTAKALIQLIKQGTFTVDSFKRALVANCSDVQLAKKIYTLVLTNLKKA